MKMMKMKNKQMIIYINKIQNQIIQMKKVKFLKKISIKMMNN